MAVVRQVVVELIARTDRYRAGLRQAAATTTATVSGIGARVRGLSATTQAAVGAAAAGIGAIANDAIRAASDLGESMNAVNVVFGDAADQIFRFGEAAASQVGMARSDINQMAAQTGALLLNFGLSASEAADETINLTKRAADMASVFNTDVTQAMVAIQAALRGETEPIRRFAVTLDDASVRAKAVEMGLAATTSEVTRQEKALASLRIIYEQTDRVAGDFVNTQDELANQQRIAAAEAENLKAELGAMFLPIKKEALRAAVSGMGLLQGRLRTIKAWSDRTTRGVEFMRTELDFLRRQVGDFSGNEAAAMVTVLSRTKGALVDNEDAIRSLAREVGASAQDLDRAADAVEEMAEQLGISDDDAAAYADQMRRLADESREVEREQRLFASALRDVDDDAESAADTIRDSLAAETRALKQPLQDILDVAGRFRDAANAMKTPMVEALQAVGYEAGVTIDDILRLKATMESVNELGLVGVETGVIDVRGSKRRRGQQVAFRRHGGAATPGVPLVVGEAGPEVFVPQTAGRIDPNPPDGRRLAGGSTIQLVLPDGRVLFDWLVDEARRVG